MSLVDITGLEKPEVLLALYTNSHPEGNGFWDVKDNVTIEDCEDILEDETYIENFFGRVIMVDFDSDTEIESHDYDAHCGRGSCERVIDELREDRGL